VVPAEVGVKAIGHFGFFRPKMKLLWQETVAWLEERVPATRSAKPRAETPV
jgi:hypothetical protein